MRKGSGNLIFFNSYSGIRRPEYRTVPILCLFIFIFLPLIPTNIAVSAQLSDTLSYISVSDGEGRFDLAVDGQPVPLYISSSEYEGVVKAFLDLREDLGRVTHTKPNFAVDYVPNSNKMVIAGTVGKSPLIDTLVRRGQLNVDSIKGKWEASITQTVYNPLPGIDEALVIAGSDMRGTIYGIYELSEQIGVSPWYWWADVPVPHQPDLYVLPGHHRLEEPAVKYRGIFINDEAPSLSGWVYENFGGFNREFFKKVFELILRMKGNYLWPAMWGRAFYVDDPLNPRIADEYGVVIGTSHHEPMMRAHDEWRRFGRGEWNYQTNDSTLQNFWREGIQRMGNNESIVTIGMRGDGDKAMSEERNIALLEQIVEDQREILEEVTGKEASEIPQVWALYKEVQEYYDMGMKVPEDVTLLFADDNWGNIRRLPEASDSLREGGYGVYYHYDYVGGPRSYKWLNTNQVPRVWEQMHLAWKHNATRIWIVNVGDIKPMEFPINFFLDYAWDPGSWPAERLPDYTRQWAAQQFGSSFAEPIAEILSEYSRYNSRRKPELLSPDTYSLTHYREAERVVENYNRLADRARQIYHMLPEEYKAAYYQLVLYPVEASANLNNLYVTVAKNRLYARQGRAGTNILADSARTLFKRDSLLARYYNKEMAGGKWNHMMDQSNIGYKSWDQPEHDIMPKVHEIEIPDPTEMGVAIQGTDEWWPASDNPARLPEFDPYQKQIYYIEVFNRGDRPFNYRATSGASWMRLSSKGGTIDNQERFYVSVDWEQIPKGMHRVPITITGPDSSRVIIEAVANNAAGLDSYSVEGFVESNGHISMEAEHYTRKVETDSVYWQKIPGLGRTLSGMTPFPVTAQSQIPMPDGNTPRLEYDITLRDTGYVEVKAYLSPTLNFHDTDGLRYAVSIDDNPPQIVNMHSDESHGAWQQWVSNNINIMSSRHKIETPGKHTLKFWMVDPAIVLQKIVIDAGGEKPSYLGPPSMMGR